MVQGSGNRTPTGIPGSKLEGETMVPFPSNPIPGMFLLISSGPLTGWSSLECGNPSPPPDASQEHWVYWCLLFLPPSLLHSLAPRNPSARGGLRGWKFRSEIPVGFLGFEWAGEMLAVLTFDPMIPPRSLHIPTVGGPLPAWESLLSPKLSLRGANSSRFHFSSPFPSPHVLPGNTGVPPILRCLGSTTSAW